MVDFRYIHQLRNNSLPYYTWFIDIPLNGEKYFNNRDLSLFMHLHFNCDKTLIINKDGTAIRWLVLS